MGGLDVCIMGERKSVNVKIGNSCIIYILCLRYKDRLMFTWEVATEVRKSLSWRGVRSPVETVPGYACMLIFLTIYTSRFYPQVCEAHRTPLHAFKCHL